MYDYFNAINHKLKLLDDENIGSDDYKEAYMESERDYFYWELDPMINVSHDDLEGIANFNRFLLNSLVLNSIFSDLLKQHFIQVNYEQAENFKYNCFAEDRNKPIISAHLEQVL